MDELGRPMHTVKLTPPQMERQKLDSNGAWSIRIEPAYAIKSLVVLGDLAIAGYHQGYLQAIDMISRSQRWLKRAEDADVNLLPTGTSSSASPRLRIERTAGRWPSELAEPLPRTKWSFSNRRRATRFES